MTRNGKELPRSSLPLILKQIILAPFGLRGLFVPGIDDRTGCRSSLPHPQTEKQPVFVTLNNTVTLDAPQHLAMQHARRVRSRCLGIGVRRYGIVRVSELIWLLRSKSSTALVYVIASVPSLLNLCHYEWHHLLPPRSISIHSKHLPLILGLIVILTQSQG